MNQNNIHDVLTEDEREFVTTALQGLPPVIARHEVSHYLGGLVSPNSMRNSDLEGDGPEVAWRVGKKIAYKTESLILWIVQNKGVERVKNTRSL
jgi:hypothetical protein